MNSKTRHEQFRLLTAAVRAIGNYPKTKIELCDEILNAVTVTGEVPSEAANEELTELARQHGFLALAEDLFIPC
ncbi:MAG: hypothetical protein QGH45_14200 [Myxococcota bacterium]|jgi:ferric-dicitrate binding protein FerR (iron transport regulator)|nr:hypothetical protein [Myxococcota bacterium]